VTDMKPRADEISLSESASSPQGSAADDDLLARIQREQDRFAFNQAAASGDVEAIEALVSRGADARSQGIMGHTPLMIAVDAVRLAAAQALLPHSDPDAVTEPAHGSRTALMMAATGRQPRMIEILAPVSDTGRRSYQGKTALMLAAEQASPECVRLLLPYGHADAQDAHGDTALMLAALELNESCVRLLLPCSDLSLRNERGQTPLMNAAAAGDAPSIELLAPLFDPDELDRDKHGALYYAAIETETEALEALLKFSSPNLEIAGDNGETVLMGCVINGFDDSARVLLKNGANPNARNAAGLTPLMLSALHSNRAMAELLIPVSDISLVAPGENGPLGAVDFALRRVADGEQMRHSFLDAFFEIATPAQLDLGVSLLSSPMTQAPRWFARREALAIQKEIQKEAGTAEDKGPSVAPNAAGGAPATRRV